LVQEHVMIDPTINRIALHDIVRQLPAEQRQVVLALVNRPGLLLDVAVRVLRLPEEVAGPLRSLSEAELVRADEFAGGPFGSSLYQLTPLGAQVAAVLNDGALLREIDGAPLPAAAPLSDLRGASDANPLQKELDLLTKLGSLAEQEGKIAEASEYYKQALAVSRKLADSSASYSQP
jgi:hypothetical protein